MKMGHDKGIETLPNETEEIKWQEYTVLVLNALCASCPRKKVTVKEKRERRRKEEKVTFTHTQKYI